MSRKPTKTHSFSPATKPIRNKLLAALTAKDLERLLPDLERVDMPLRERFSKPGKPIEYAYFPESGMISLVQPLEDGGMVEVGIIGREGFFGVPLLLGTNSSPLEAMVQGTGGGLRMRAAVLLEHAARMPALQAILLRFAQALHVQVAQTAVCNGKHILRQRLARWLLEAHDRFGLQVRLSHEFLSLMLGTRRAGVTVAVNALGAKHLVEMGRGYIEIVTAKGLEAAACECYRTVQNEYKRLLP